MDFSDFCTKYYEIAKEMATKELRKSAAKLGSIDIHVDLDYVIDEVVLIALEKTCKSFEASRGKDVTCLLATVVRNELVDALERENKAASRKSDIEDVEVRIRDFISTQTESQGRDVIIDKLYEAIKKLSESDRIIIENYLDDRRTYVAESAKELCISENNVCVRKNRILEKLYEHLKDFKKSFKGEDEPETIQLSQIGQFTNFYDTESLQKTKFLVCESKLQKEAKTLSLALKFLTKF
ncbi:MAG: sigma-70 family RNA polymerase sigma factor [Bacteroidales bacterium]|nr:sigma-70 family RNA polymerase sigma factor [Bacteroidales bacterium]